MNLYTSFNTFENYSDHLVYIESADQIEPPWESVVDRIAKIVRVTLCMVRILFSWVIYLLTEAEKALDPHVDVENARASDPGDLIQVQEPEEGRSTRVLHADFSQDLWDSMLHMIDLSYEAARVYSGDETRAEEQERLEGLIGERSWSNLTYLDGSSGARNQVKDRVGFMATHDKTRTIAIVLHGSFRKADWEANFAIGLTTNEQFAAHQKGGRYHGGYLNNFMSIQDALISHVAKESRRLGQRFRVVITGHSSGGAKAIIAGAALRARFPKLKLWVVPVSGPTATDSDSASYLRQELGEDNILLPTTPYDPVTQLLNLHGEYQSVGTVLVDDTKKLKRRVSEFHLGKEHTTVWTRVLDKLFEVVIGPFASYHYGGMKGMPGSGQLSTFVPDLVMPHRQLSSLLADEQ